MYGFPGGQRWFVIMEQSHTQPFHGIFSSGALYALPSGGLGCAFYICSPSSTACGYIWESACSNFACWCMPGSSVEQGKGEEYFQSHLAGKTTCLYGGTVSLNPGTWSSLGGLQPPHTEVCAPLRDLRHPDKIWQGEYRIFAQCYLQSQSWVECCYSRTEAI